MFETPLIAQYLYSVCLYFTCPLICKYHTDRYSICWRWIFCAMKSVKWVFCDSRWIGRNLRLCLFCDLLPFVNKEHNSVATFAHTSSSFSSNNLLCALTLQSYQTLCNVCFWAFLVLWNFCFHTHTNIIVKQWVVDYGVTIYSRRSERTTGLF